MKLLPQRMEYCMLHVLYRHITVTVCEAKKYKESLSKLLSFYARLHNHWSLRLCVYEHRYAECLWYEYVQPQNNLLKLDYLSYNTAILKPRVRCDDCGIRDLWFGATELVRRVAIYIICGIVDNMRAFDCFLLIKWGGPLWIDAKSEMRWPIALMHVFAHSYLAIPKANLKNNYSAYCLRLHSQCVL